MKRIIYFLIVTFALFSAAGCVHLAVRPEEEPMPEMISELETILAEVSYRDWRYERYIFDCSNMSAYLYDYLTLKGYKCEIMIGIPYYFWRLRDWFSDIHVWLIVKKDGKIFWIDSVEKEIVHPSYFKKYVIRFHFTSLNDLKEFSGTIGQSWQWSY